ncbi:hypothetical protein [Leminorella grimontii]|uniref:hypothetical protein n=1 Tax=Leminorella grimontii TaxID=82981 RepID=UPI00207F2A82|nr:hypothetical protein [Leminorella grimontii]GKX58358.1 hypothetical protein SOASR031_06730 [Leminorella grimontii]
MNALIKHAAPGVLIFLMGLVIWWGAGRLADLGEKLEKSEKELKSEQQSNEQLRRQYGQIQEVLDDVAKKKSESDREAGRLRVELDEAQRSIPCAGQRVPDAVTVRLCERVAAVNAATDTK